MYIIRIIKPHGVINLFFNTKKNTYISIRQIYNHLLSSNFCLNITKTFFLSLPPSSEVRTIRQENKYIPTSTHTHTHTHIQNKKKTNNGVPRHDIPTFFYPHIHRNHTYTTNLLYPLYYIIKYTHIHTHTYTSICHPYHHGLKQERAYPPFVRLI